MVSDSVCGEDGRLLRFSDLRCDGCHIEGRCGPLCSKGKEKRIPVAGPFDLLQLPLLGSLLRRRRTRLVLQGASFLLLAAIVVDGLRGPQQPAHNLAGHLLWDLLRPLNLVLLLLVGNLFCMACPFTFLRELAAAVGLPLGVLAWPARLRTKWIAAALLPLYLWSYLHLGLDRSPRRSALLLIAYVVAATLFNGLFRTAVFCKHLCPMGHFNALLSRLAPLTVQVKSPRTCSGCASHACVQGTASLPGCPMQLYLPQKIGNLDCTLCLRCVQACPNENIQIGVQRPLRDLAEDPEPLVAAAALAAAGCGAACAQRQLRAAAVRCAGEWPGCGCVGRDLRSAGRCWAALADRCCSPRWLRGACCCCAPRWRRVLHPLTKEAAHGRCSAA